MMVIGALIRSDSIHAYANASMLFLFILLGSITALEAVDFDTWPVMAADIVSGLSFLCPC